MSHTRHEDDRRRDWTRVLRANGARQVEGLEDPRAGESEVIAFEEFGNFYVYGPYNKKTKKRPRLAMF